MGGLPARQQLGGSGGGGLPAVPLLAPSRSGGRRRDHQGHLQSLVAAQSVLAEAYWSELRTGLVTLGHDVFHVLLDADAKTLHARIDADNEEPERIRPWRHRHVDVYEAARAWLIDSADLVVDTATLDAPATARRIESALAGRTHGHPDLPRDVH